MIDFNVLNHNTININALIGTEMENQITLMKNINWFHGVLSRKGAEKKLSVNGEFLLRLSLENENSFVLSTKTNGKFLHVIVKNEFDVKKKQIIYYIVPKLKFSTIVELINCHLTEKHSLNSSSDAVLHHAVCTTDIGKKEHKFRKSMHVFSKTPAKTIPRSGSAMMLGTEGGMSTFSEMNKSLTELSTTALDEPTKTSKKGFRLFANKLFPARLKSSKISLRNEKSDKENGGYLPGRFGSMQTRENVRRGLSLDALTSDLIGVEFTKPNNTNEELRPSKNDSVTSKGLNKETSSVIVVPRSASGSDSDGSHGDDIGSSQRLKRGCSSVYVNPVITEDLSKESSLAYIVHKKTSDSVSRDDLITSRPLKRGGSSIYVVPKIIEDDINSSKNTAKESSSVYIVPKNDSRDEMSRPLKRSGSSIYVMPNSTGDRVPGDDIDKNCSVKRNESVYVIPVTSTTHHSVTTSLQSSVTIGSFLNLELSNLSLYYCGPIDGAFDTAALNKASVFLLSNPQHPTTLCYHLLKEIHRILRLSSTNITVFKAGYRCLFLADSDQCQRDLINRQSAFTSFVMATIVSIGSNETRTQLMIFWIKCAECLLTYTGDMFHLRSVVTAIFSDQISNLKVWKTVYRKDPSMVKVMQSLRKAISDGCFLRTEIDKCIPDIVQLYATFTSDDRDDDFDVFCQMCFEIMDWSCQSFEEMSTSFIRINKEWNSEAFNQTIPFMSELVQTETLLSLILGKHTITARDVGPLLHKCNMCIEAMASARNEGIL